MPFYSQHKEIKAFIESVDQVLNSATVFIEQDFSKGTSVLRYIDEAFRSGKFYGWMQEALDDKTKDEAFCCDMQFRLLPFSFMQFKHMLEEMLDVKRSPYQVALSQNQIHFLVDDFIESTINAEQEKSHLQRIEELDAEWRFYTLPRNMGRTDPYEIDYCETKGYVLSKNKGEEFNHNYLSEYFYGFGGDAFLVFYNNKKIFFLLTNGSD